MDDSTEKMLAWFDDDELADCPSCLRRKVVPAQVGESLLVCAACGIVPKPTT